jgi:hypothetical protein
MTDPRALAHLPLSPALARGLRGRLASLCNSPGASASGAFFHGAGAVGRMAGASAIPPTPERGRFRRPLPCGNPSARGLR